MECPPLTGCGTQHPHRALGGTCVLLAAAPTTSPCFRRWRRSSLLLGIFSGKIILIKQSRSICGRSGFVFSRVGGVTENGSCSAAFCESAALRESAVGLCPHPSAPFGRSHLPPTGGRQPSQGELNSLSQNLTVLPAPSGREPLAWRQRLRLKCKVPAAKNLPLRGRWHRAAMTERVRSPGGAVAQRLRGFKSAEPEKTVKRSSRRTGVNLQFFPVQPTSLGLSRACSP